MTHIKTLTKRTVFGFIGRIEVSEDKRRLWSKTTGITRQSRADALEDARALKTDTILCNKGVQYV